jgi:predicted N-formylglutamate amidohydrolase
VHSFTPVLDGQIRDFELGLLYDPARSAEARFAAAFKGALQRDSPGIRVRRNAPYRGNADGLTTAMRKERSERKYLGIELELNQRAISTGAQRAKLVEALSRALPDRVRGGA